MVDLFVIGVFRFATLVTLAVAIEAPIMGHVAYDFWQDPVLLMIYDNLFPAFLFLSLVITLGAAEIWAHKGFIPFLKTRLEAEKTELIQKQGESIRELSDLHYTIDELKKENKRLKDPVSDAEGKSVLNEFYFDNPRDTTSSQDMASAIDALIAARAEWKDKRDESIPSAQV